nr:RNA-directed DNA polymerase, eukaryota, reverse transcriptase zinc-binding domain protein [Tanacetum cinerariifolium]
MSSRKVKSQHFGTSSSDSDSSSLEVKSSFESKRGLEKVTDLPSRTLMGEKSSHEGKLLSLLLPDVSSDSLDTLPMLQPRSSKVKFILSSFQSQIKLIHTQGDLTTLKLAWIGQRATNNLIPGIMLCSPRPFTLLQCYTPTLWVIKEVIDEFGDVSGLLNYNKIIIIFRSINEEDRNKILEVVPFRVEELPLPNITLWLKKSDVLMWKRNDRALKKFTVRIAYHDLQSSQNNVSWKDLGETLYEYYWRFSQLINDMHTIGMPMQQVQVNTNFLNALLSKWRKFVNDVKLAKSLYTINYDQLYAYPSQHERHANQCTQPEKPRNSAWFKEKLMLVEAQEAGKILDEEQLAFIADLGIAKV